MKLQFTAVFEQVPEGYVGYVEELPGANTQGATLDEARANLAEAVELVLEANRTLAEERLGDRKVIREPLRITPGSPGSVRLTQTPQQVPSPPPRSTPTARG